MRAFIESMKILESQLTLCFAANMNSVNTVKLQCCKPWIVPKSSYLTQ